MRKIILLFLFLLSTNTIFSEISINSEEIENGWSISIENQSNEIYEVMIISTNHNYSPDKNLIYIEAGSSVIFNYITPLSHNPDAENTGIRLISDHPDNPGLYLLDKDIIEPANSIENDNNDIILEYYYTPSCSSCNRFLQAEIPIMESRLGLKIYIEKVDVHSSEGLRRLNSRLAELDSLETKLPILIYDNTILAGDSHIINNLEDLISGSYIETNSISRSNELKILPVLAAGLIDGINPCAFTTMIFLISYLNFVKRDRKSILITVLVFTLTVFTTYYLIGLGAFNILKSSQFIPLLFRVIKYLIVAILAVLSILHLYDYFLAKKGKSDKIVLQLSKDRKRKIHSIIRNRVKITGLLAGAILLGFLVTLYELGCTGQIYLPTLMYMIRVEKEFSHYMLLGIYNLGFIFPLVVLFIAIWRGLSSKIIAGWFEGKLAKIKLISALFFLTMAILLLVI